MHRFIRPRNPRQERSIARVASVALFALLGLALGGALDASHAATSCVVLPREGKLPPHAAEARELFASYVPEVPGGWEVKAEQARKNRKDVAEGLITAREADERGGLAVGGTLAVPVLATLYNDSPAAPPFASVAALQTQLFGANPTGSMTDYYEEVSYGNLNVTGTVFGWRRATDPMLSYTVNNGLGGGGKDFVRDAIARHDATVNFANFDNDGDGFVDIVVVVHPTMGAECTGGGVNMWSHHHFLTANGGLPAFTADGVLVDRYFVAPALSCVAGAIEIGVFCHEMGHALGIPDLYDTGDSTVFYEWDSQGIGNWGLMGAGGANPASPSHMEAFSKERLGWLTYLNVPNDLTHLCLPPVETSPVAARVWSQGSIGPEYFLVENRQLLGFDTSLPAPGLVIYHVDEDVYDNLRSQNRVNAYETHKAIDVECADASAAGNVLDADDLDSNLNRGDGGDPWCGPAASSWFNANSIPDTRAYSGTATGVAIQNVGHCTTDPTTQPGWVCADYVVGVSNPVDLCIEDCPSDNCNEIATCGEYWASPNIWIDNDGLGGHDVPAPGIANKVWVRFKNLGPQLEPNPKIRLYAAKGTAGLEWPNDADIPLGEVGATILAAGDMAEDVLTFEYPSLFGLEGHYCIGAVADDGGPSVSTQANLSNNIAQVNSQVLFARAGGVGKALACPGGFTKSSQIYLRDGYNPTQDVRKAVVRVGSPPGFNDAVIPVGWTLSILPSTGPFFLSPGMKDSVTVRVNSANAAHGQTAHIPITLWDADLNVPIGGVTMDFVIDCNDPAAPQNGVADWTTPPGDDIGGPTVLVQWDPVLLDVLGGPETTLYYVIYRSLDEMLPYVPVDSVAIDAEPLMPGFQWYDDLPRDHCPAKARYAVGAIDGTGASGAYTDPIALPCAATGVGASASGEPSAGFSAATPNPFQRSTTIAFNLPDAGDLELEIFNPQGERVRTLARGHRPAGDQRFEWDGLDSGGSPAASGIYFYRIVAIGISETRKIVLAR